MKLRPILVLLLFVMSIAVLTWIYYTTSLGTNSRRPSPWQTTLNDLDEYSRTKYVKSTQYNHFAEIADKEQIAHTARLFRALALSENIHEQNCAKVIRRFGGSYTSPTKVALFEGKTADNLIRSIAFERQLHDTRGKTSIDHALASGNRYAARILIWSNAGDMRHVMLMEQCSIAPDTTASGRYAVCPTCGNVYAVAFCDHYCPFCLTSEAEFVRFEL